MNFFSNLFAKTPPKSYSTDPSSSIALGPDDDVPGPGQQFSQFGAGCFWGVELAFQRVPGVTKTEVGYSQSVVHNPSYNDVCSETTKHSEVARVQYDPSESSFGDLLDVFWSRHDPTTINRQAGCGIGGMLSAIHGFNTGIPFVQNHVKGPKWLPFVIGVPPLLMFSAASAAFGGYALPKFTQLTVTSYYAASSASHYGISLLIRHIEETNTPHSKSEKIS